jgi:SAM-dependent methyltransferase
VLGADFGSALIEHAKTWADRENLNVVFERQDMRELPYKCQFNAIYMMDVSFGIFDDVTNQSVLKAIALALKDNGRLLLELFNPYNIASMVGTNWFLNTANRNATLPTYTEILPKDHICLLERKLDIRRGLIEFPTTIIRHGGITESYPTQQIRLYTCPELEQMLNACGLHIETISDESGLSMNPSSMFCYVVAKKV